MVPNGSVVTGVVKRLLSASAAVVRAFAPRGKRFSARHAANVKGRPVTQSRCHALRTYVFLRYMSLKRGHEQNIHSVTG
jgi:hypothetical protein